MSNVDREYSQAVFNTDEQVNAVWILISSAFILFMQCGTALFNAGSTQKKNLQSVLVMKLFEACLGVLGFWLIGYGIAFGKVEKIIGKNVSYYASSGFEDVPEDNYELFMFQVAFSIASTTMISGSMAERAQLPQQILFTFIQQSFIYPVVIAWVWGGGWLTQKGYHDFAGSGCIHVLGGTCGFVGAVLLGPRINKYKQRKIKNERQDSTMNSAKRKLDDTLQIQPIIELKLKQQKRRQNSLINQIRDEVDFEKGQARNIVKSLKDKNKIKFKKWVLDTKVDLSPSNAAYITLGTFINWIGWLFFNSGSTLSMQIPRLNGPSKIMFNTMLASSISGLVVVFLKPHIMRNYSKVNQYDVGQFCNGICAGLIGITAPCDCVEPWAAIAIGVGAGLSENRGTYFAWQLCGLITIMAWAGSISFLYFLIVKKLGYLRVDPVVEIIGLDRSYFGGLTKKDLKMLQSLYNERRFSKSSSGTDAMSQNYNQKIKVDFEEGGSGSPQSYIEIDSSSAGGDSTVLNMKLRSQNSKFFQEAKLDKKKSVAINNNSKNFLEPQNIKINGKNSDRNNTNERRKSMMTSSRKMLQQEGPSDYNRGVLDDEFGVADSIKLRQ
eukprot:403341033